LSASGAEHPGLNDAQPAFQQARFRDHLLAQLDLRDVPAKKGGELAIEMPLGSHLVNNRGGLQGGLVATLIDVCAGRVALAGLPPGMSAATTDLNVHYLSAVRVGPARAEAVVLRRGRTKIVLRSEVYDAGRDDALCAFSTITFQVVALREGQPDIRPKLTDGSSDWVPHTDGDGP
jgi:uncharacterized protein (TIGR00369 family)